MKAGHQFRTSRSERSLLDALPDELHARKAPQLQRRFIFVHQHIAGVQGDHARLQRLQQHTIIKPEILQFSSGL